ncbi:MAG: hypothetical protein AB1649_03455 [Chloroflexota bacterium]
MWKKTLVVLLFAVTLALVALAVPQRERDLSTSSTSIILSPSATSTPDFSVSIPQKALLENYLTVSAEAAPGTDCRLTFIAPSGEIQVMDTVADENRLCEWRWKLAISMGKGAGRLIFTINGMSDTHFIQIFASF